MCLKMRIFAYLILLSLPMTAMASSTSTVGACVDTSSGCVTTSPTIDHSTPAWKSELLQVQSANQACQSEIEKYCEGVQVGKGRIERCLKQHIKDLSAKCRGALGLATK